MDFFTSLLMSMLPLLILFGIFCGFGMVVFILIRRVMGAFSKSQARQETLLAEIKALRDDLSQAKNGEV